MCLSPSHSATKWGSRLEGVKRGEISVGGEGQGGMVYGREGGMEIESGCSF